jgi:toxin ParE1/3/4
MTSLVVSPRARGDLDDIWDYGVERWGIDQAERYLREMWHDRERAAKDPRRGQPCDDIRASYFRLKVGFRVAFYRLTTEGIDVVRILHGRRDFERHL